MSASTAMSTRPAKTDDAGLRLLMEIFERNKALEVEPHDWASLGPHLGISKQAVGYWYRTPLEHVFKIEEDFGIPRYVLRPDVYPAPPARPRFEFVSTRTGTRVRIAKARRR